MEIRNVLYAFACLAFSIVIGGAVYEHIAVVPRWTAAPPVSLSMFQGPYGLNPAPFWKNIHPVTLLLLVISLALFWKTERRNYLLFTIAGYVLILIITFLYFVPTLIAITGTPYNETADALLTSSAKTWETLSLVRLAVLVLLAITAFLGLTRSGSVSKLQHKQEVMV
ncbi:hypothetical protein [Flavihumibacter sp. UBA7668]|uniref:hypothetical protein n=1 Tax=Flavihumibacter sp. UBA7668 TaxID=1946542 RepID=UPI0025C515D4|nr:hypothetical protein [Flavihumibacter sp. UBA7668]